MAEYTRPAPRRLWRRIGGIGLAAVVLLGLAGAALFAGYEIATRQLFPHAFLARVDGKLERTFFPAAGREHLQDAAYPTALLRVEAEVGLVDVGRSQTAGSIAENGGGLTSFGDDVLLLPYNGRIYAARGADSIRDTGLAAPDNNRAAYQALEDDPAFAEYRFSPGYLRYNDLEYFRGDGRHGLIASYTEYHPGETCFTNTLARLDFDPGAASIDEVEAAPGDWQVIFRTAPCLPFKTRYLAMEGHMASGRIAFEAPGTIYLSSGDFHLDGMRSDGAPIAQDPGAQYGKVLALGLDGEDARILSMGHRNVQGMVLAPDGRLITVEHGPQGGDEVNIVREGANFGWPRESYGLTYSGTPIPGAVSFGRHETFAAPVFAWIPSVATAGVAYVDGFHPAWNGDLLVASLIDKSLYRLRLEGDRAVYAERIEIGQRIRDVHQHSDGRIVLWTDNEEMVFLKGLDLPDRALTVAQFVERSDLDGATAARLETELARCAECHSFQIDEHTKSPSLARIHGDEIASTPFDGYSDALRAKSGEWTDENLAALLLDPQDFAPGTFMPGLEDPELVDEVIAYLKLLDRQF